MLVFAAVLEVRISKSPSEPRVPFRNISERGNGQSVRASPSRARSAACSAHTETKQFDPCSLRLSKAFSNPPPWSASTSLNYRASNIRTKWPWFGCVREESLTEAENGPKWARGRLLLVRINEQKGRRSAGFQLVPSAEKRMSRLGVLAEGEELSSNPLRCVFNDLRSTQIAVDVAWRILGGCGGLLSSSRAVLCHDLHFVDPTQNAAAIHTQIPPAETRATVQDQAGASDSERHNRGPHQIGKAEHRGSLDVEATPLVLVLAY